MKLCIFIPAYNCGSALTRVVARIPKEIWHKNPTILVVDDASTDDTLTCARALKQKYLKVHIIHNTKNLGYAGTQKRGFAYALKHNFDVTVLLHDDGQYAPEEMGKLLEPIRKNHADIVHGSRMLGNPRDGGMPWIKYIGTTLMAKIENWVCGMNMSDWHSGYVAYSQKALKTIPFHSLGDSFHFDGEMLFVANLCGLHIIEVPITTNYFGDARSLLRPIPYMFSWIKILWNYKRGMYHKTIQSTTADPRPI